MAPPVLESVRAVRLSFNGAFVCASAPERLLLRSYCSAITVNVISVLDVSVKYQDTFFNDFHNFGVCKSTRNSLNQPPTRFTLELSTRTSGR